MRNISYLDNNIINAYGLDALHYEFQNQYSTLISNSIPGASGSLSFVNGDDVLWNTPKIKGLDNKEGTHVGGGSYGFLGSLLPLYDGNHNLKSLSEFVNTSLHESLHTYITHHPFEYSYGADDNMYYLGYSNPKDKILKVSFESIPGVTNPNMKNNIMWYPYMILDWVKLGDYWKENGLPLYLTNSQLNRIYKEIEIMKTVDPWYYINQTRPLRDFNERANGKQIHK